MKIDKAIEVLSLSANQGTTTFNPDYKAAQLLGIEALKTVKAIRHYPFPDGVIILPGETLE